MTRIRLLALGHIGSHAFLKQHYSALKANLPNLIVHLNTKSVNFSQNDKYNAMSCSDSVVNIEQFRIREHFRLSDLLGTIRPYFLRDYFLQTASRNHLSIRKKLLLDLRQNQLRRIQQTKGYDIYQFHYCSVSNLQLMNALPDHSKILCTFWGSDLLREETDCFEYHEMIKYLSRADLITIQNRELKEALMIKFGRNLEEKIRIAQFPGEVELFDAIDNQIKKLKNVQEFQARLEINPNNIVVIIGNNANEGNQHGKIISALTKLPEEIRDELSIVIPCNYSKNNKAQYQQLLHDDYRAFFGQLIIINDFLDWQDIASLRLTADYYIHLPISDAMSATFTEALYAGSICFSGCWLPFGRFRRIGLDFIEIESFEHLAPQLKKAILQGNHKQKKKNYQDRRVIIRKFFLGEQITHTWIDILNELIS
ncbi:hypothetical protein N9I61_00950 [Flavobacteriales bacterium]|nr:hypothetical protein [Flavobacteriales bacterium]